MSPELRRVCVAARQRFPIPMRGNETHSRHCAGCTIITFPIPMRGNELLSRMSAGGYPAFPIPMRGNELLLHETDELGQEKFPIPMRGNEVPHCQSSSGSIKRVPNPYEG